MSIKALLRYLPGGKALAEFARNVRAEKIDSSADYWEARYQEGGNSGAGSYGRLARFKADFLNGFVQTAGVVSVLEFGSGDGAQLMLAQYPSYTGVDVSHTILAAVRERFSDRPNMQFVHASDYSPESKAELVLSLDVIFHLVEDDVFEAYMQRLFDASLRYVIIYSSNDSRGFVAPHVRHRKFTKWVDRNRRDFALVKRQANPYPDDPADPENTSFADFYVFEKRS